MQGRLVPLFESVCILSELNFEALCCTAGQYGVRRCYSTGGRLHGRLPCAKLCISSRLSRLVATLRHCPKWATAGCGGPGVASQGASPWGTRKETPQHDPAAWCLVMACRTYTHVSHFLYPFATTRFSTLALANMHGILVAV